MSDEHYYDTSAPIDHIDDKPSDPYGISSEDIDSGIRKTLNTCQYWIKGMPGVCTYWQPGDPGNCTYSKIDNKTKLTLYPNGWNEGHCDFLGRQYSCNGYELAGEEDLNEYICIATCPYRSGLYKRDNEDEPWRAVRSSEIRGHNPDSNFVGHCDGCGFGRGINGFSYSNAGEDCSAEAFENLHVVCNYYRPWHMGFGAKVPKTTDITKAVIDKKTGRIVGDERDYFDERLPFSFKVYNVRAKIQKCAWWNADEGSDFVLDAAGLYLDGGDLCSNPDDAATPYHTEAVSGPSEELLLENVWSKAGCIICNGARSNCPGYTGNWIYCVDDRLEKGDKISAQQVLELRFWMNDWAGQEEYDSVFKRPPNKLDPDTSDIYTYGRWAVISTTPDESLLLGKRVSLCIPNVRYEFNTDLIQVEEMKFINKGTSAPSEPNQVHFPSLIRDIEEWTSPPLNIIYPYASKDPFNEDLNPSCSDQIDQTPCIKRNYSIDGDSVSVIGWTVRNKTIYAFNATIAGYGGISELIENSTTLAVQNIRSRIAFNEAMDIFIDGLKRQDKIYETSSNSDGLFMAGPVDIEYKKLNELVVCFKYEGNWYFRKRSVWSQWHGGVVIQNKFEHKYDGIYVDDGYSVFTPPASAEAKIYPLHGVNEYNANTAVGSVLGANKSLVYSDAINYYYRHSYCIKKTTIEEFDVIRWRRVDNAGTLWIEIDDINLNYIFEWGVKNVFAELRDDEDNVLESVEMEKTFPIGTTHSQINIHPNACMIAPKNGVKKGFFSGDNWVIKVDYWYKEISNDSTTSDNVTIEYPDLSILTNRFAEATYDIEIERNTISVSNIQSSTVAILTLFVDENGRLVSTFATKMLVEVARTFCREVEIRYGWKAKFITYELEPQRGFLRIDEDGPFRAVQVGTTEMGSVIPCGDHEIGYFSGLGPMWYPYSSCETMDFYDVWTGANSVVASHENTPRYDYRYMTPIKNVPFCEPHSTLYDCAEDWGCSYHTIVDGSIIFTGKAYRRGDINVDLYNAFGWAKPKFGNVLREYVERFKSIDNFSYLSYKTGLPIPSVAWMPLVMDDSCFLYDFNSIDGDDIIYINQLNLMSSSSESISTGVRFDFDSIFGIRRAILASYPPPLIESDFVSALFVAYYYFKDDFTQWAWQEKWRDIERDNRTLEFLDLEKPDYIFDLYKQEHRFIISEGSVTLSFTAPVFDEPTLTLQKWPSIKLGSGEERFFKILYGEYDDSLVDWEDDDDGFVGASGDPNIYGITTTSGEWIHAHPDPYTNLNNMLYDASAVSDPQAAEDADRKIVTAYDEALGTTSYVYNRGLIAQITKDKLKYLPFSEATVSADTTSYSPDPNVTIQGAQASWNDISTVEINLTFDPKPCVSKVKIIGYTGNEIVSFAGEDIKINVNQPSINIYENGGTEPIASRDAIYLTESEKRAGISLDFWTKEIDLEVNPTRMLQAASRTETLKIELGSTMGAISIVRILIYTATYKDETESIMIYERKYNVSRGTYGDYNPDGAWHVLSYEHNFDNSGIYYNDELDSDASITASNKMRKISAGERYDDFDDSNLAISDYSDLLEAEGEQKLLYEFALEQDGSDKSVYKTIIPPNWAEFLASVGASSGNFSGESVTITSEKVIWNNHPLTGGYRSYETWSPEGYFYRWGQNTRSAKCYLIDTHHDIMVLEFLNVYENIAQRAATGVQSYYGLRAWHILLQEERDLFIKSDAARRTNEFQFRGAIDLMTGGGRL